MTLFNETGGSLQSRIEEAERLVKMLLPLVDNMTPREAEFVQTMFDATSVSPKQLFWLRDINMKYL